MESYEIFLVFTQFEISCRRCVVRGDPVFNRQSTGVVSLNKPCESDRYRSPPAEPFEKPFTASNISLVVTSIKSVPAGGSGSKTLFTAAVVYLALNTRRVSLQFSAMVSAEDSTLTARAIAPSCSSPATCFWRTSSGFASLARRPYLPRDGLPLIRCQVSQICIDDGCG